MTGVLLVRLSAMGDLVQGLGAVAALHAARPDWRLTFVTQTTWAPLLEGFPGVHRVVTFDRRGGLAALRRLRRSLREERFDVALDLQGNWKSAMVAWLGAAKLRVGASAAFRQEPRSRFLLNRIVDVDAGPPHPARCAFAMVRAVAPDAIPHQPRLTARPAELEREERALTALGVDVERPFRVVVVTRANDTRSLSAYALSAAERDGAGRTVYVYGPRERDVPHVGTALVLRHGDEPRRLVALGALVARAGGVVIGPDQGATHVLAAAGAECRVGFGATDPLRSGPPGARWFVHAEPPPCSPCRAEHCENPAGRVCMEFAVDRGREIPHDPSGCR